MSKQFNRLSYLACSLEFGYIFLWKIIATLGYIPKLPPPKHWLVWNSKGGDREGATDLRSYCYAAAASEQSVMSDKRE
jgi:hypothetical protein